MSLVLSDELIRQTQSTEEELRQDIAVMLYGEEKLTLAQASRFLGVGRLEFQKILADHDVPIHYTVEDLRNDLKTLEELNL
jgi:predicted HTH domain antitoxin